MALCREIKKRVMTSKPFFMELRKIAHELEHASPGNMELLERFDKSLMEVRALLE